MRNEKRYAILMAMAGILLCSGSSPAAMRSTAVWATPEVSASQAEFEACDEMMYVNCSVLRVHSSVSLEEATVVSSLNRGTRIQRVGKNKEWSIVLIDGVKRYVASEYLSANPPAASNSADQSSGPDQGAESGKAGTNGGTEIGLDSGYRFAEFSKIKSGKAVLYKSTAQKKKNKTVCVNAGHGTSGGGSVKTLCHPDGTPKVTGGTTGAGATSAVAVSSGMTFSDGTAESKVTLKMANILKERLLAGGYNVLMIRESSDIQLDNIARTVIANNNADCHLALHWDSTTSNKGCFFMSVPGKKSYRSMEPVASHWQDHNRLGESLITGLKAAGNKIFSGGSMEMDLTQTSYSTVPSVDIELGDKVSSHSDETLNKLADGLMAGINGFFGF